MWSTFGKPAAPAQLNAQRKHQVEHDANARQVLARETAPRLIGIDDAPGVRQRVAGQMVIGNEHAHAQRIGGGDAVDARDAVVDGDQDVGILDLFRERDDFGRQAITVFEAVGYQVIDAGAELAQRAYADRARGSAVRVVIGDDQQPLPRRNGIGKQARHAFNVVQAGQRRQFAKIRGELTRRGDAACGVYACEQRMYAGPLQRFERNLRRAAAGQIERHCSVMRQRRSSRAVARGARIATDWIA